MTSSRKRPSARTADLRREDPDVGHGERGHDDGRRSDGARQVPVAVLDFEQQRRWHGVLRGMRRDQQPPDLTWERSI